MNDNIYYGNNGFHLEQDENNSRYEITKEYWSYLLKEQEKGLLIKADINGKPILTEQEISKKDEIFFKIGNIKHNLNSTDYQIIKCYEAFMRQLPLPYNLEKLTAQRDAWREEINQLEQELKNLWNDMVEKEAANPTMV